MQIPLEDFYEDIIGKAMRGRHISEGELSEKTGIDRDTLGRICRGEFSDESALPKIAAQLGLDPGALMISASKSWLPRSVSLEGLLQFNTAYRDMRVNAFLIWDPASKEAAAFDTGTNVDDMIAEVADRGLTLKYIFLTHTHNDHVADLERLKAAAPGARVYANRLEPWPGAESFVEGASFPLGSMTIDTRTTSGHSEGGTTYVINGLARPVAVVGDALFAGSMGGGMVSFADALRNNREKIMTLPDDTVICPGHGPLTSIAEEKRHNPFFPELS
ncbi:MAG: MBL fold metallo-hydrolase [Verrucomicrobiae bacterium]|nr:MBL fold metallo-hydrolase [Verrucomicrobiae bacterium]